MIPTTDLKLYGIIGHPIGQTLSPLMHNAAFEALNIHATMQPYDIEPESLKDALESFASLGFGGLNVTIPHKQTIIPLLDYVDEEASIIGAVNTVKFEGKEMRGFNTDAYGFLKTLEPFRASLEGSRFVVLGAGGASRAVTYVLLKYFRTQQIIVVSRSHSASKDLIEHFKNFHGSRLAVGTFQDPQLPTILQRSEVIINATPVGMYPRTDDSIIEGIAFRPEQTVVDLIYRPLQTKLLTKAQNNGARIIRGLEMLIYQGARAFELWTGQQMDIPAVRKVLEARLQTG